MTANSVVNQIFQSESFVLQEGLNCPKPTIQGVGTPESLFLYQFHDSMQLVHQKAFSCTNSMIQCSWYTRKPFPVQNPRFNAVGTPESLFLYQIHDSMQLVHQKAFPCTKPTIQGVGTPDGLFLYQLHDSMQLVHQKAFSCTNSNHQIE